jgi:hypothetical protein
VVQYLKYGVSSGVEALALVGRIRIQLCDLGMICLCMCVAPQFVCENPQLGIK